MSAGETKQIVINDLFKTPSRAKTQRRPKTTVPSVEENLQQQLRRNPILFKPLSGGTSGGSSSAGVGTDEFGKSVQYMQNMMAKQKHQRVAKLIQQQPTPPSTNSFSSSFEAEPTAAKVGTARPTYVPDKEIPYGCLKGGQKPSFKAWNQTRKRFEERVFECPADEPPVRMDMIMPSSDIRPPTPPKHRDEDLHLKTDAMADAERRLNVLREYDLQDAADADVHSESMAAAAASQSKRRRLRSKPRHEGGAAAATAEEDVQPKFKTMVGKSIRNRRVAVLIGNQHTRKNIQQMQKTLKRTPIADARRYLCQHGIIKVGCQAPNDVIRSMYETVQLTGEVVNNNLDTNLHNYVHSGGGGASDAVVL
jgi:hypothetical protein